MSYMLAAESSIVSDHLISQGGPFVIVCFVLCLLAFAAWKAIGSPLVQAIVQVSSNITATTANLLKISESLTSTGTKQEIVLARLQELYANKRNKEERSLHDT
jgi:hypothetical protein